MLVIIAQFGNIPSRFRGFTSQSFCVTIVKIYQISEQIKGSKHYHILPTRKARFTLFFPNFALYFINSSYAVPFFRKCKSLLWR
jgi:hypothetical protein